MYCFFGSKFELFSIWELRPCTPPAQLTFQSQICESLSRTFTAWNSKIWISNFEWIAPTPNNPARWFRIWISDNSDYARLGSSDDYRIRPPNDLNGWKVSGFLKFYRNENLFCGLATGIWFVNWPTVSVVTTEDYLALHSEHHILEITWNILG